MTILVLKCKRCGHDWPTKQAADRVKVCPKCKTPYWDRKPKKEVKK
jgi:predicted Zn-ribbon and HTH transcriptional regulator